MPLVPIQISKGAFKNVEAFELGSAEFGAEVKNLHLNDTGSNVDRPGRSIFATIGSFPVEALTFFNDKLFAITSNDRKMWSISSSGVVTDVTGTALEGSSRPVFADDGTYLAIAGGGAPRRWSGSGNTSLLPGSPEDTKFISYLDGYWILHLLDDQEYRIAGPTAATRDIWNSSDFFSDEKHPGNVFGQYVTLSTNELFSFKSRSTQVFQNFGDSTTPLQPTVTIPRGTEAGYSVIEADNTLFWFDSVERRFVTLQGRTPVDIGTPYDRVVKGFSTVSDCWASKIDIQGLYLVAWTFPTEERTLVFDYKAKEWSEWDGFLNAQSNRMRMHSHCFAPAWNKHFVGDPINGTIWELSREYKSDGSDVMRRLRRTGVIDHGSGNRKRNNYYEFDVKRGLGASGESEPVMVVRFKDDDKPWSEPRYVGLGNTGNNAASVRMYRTGVYRKRQIEISMTDNAEFLLHKVTEDVDDLGM